MRRKSGEGYSDACNSRTVRSGGSRLVWGCFSYYGIGRLGVVDRTVNAEKYKHILEESLVPSIEERFSKENSVIFQDDSAPCHRAKLVSTNIILYFV